MASRSSATGALSAALLIAISVASPAIAQEPTAPEPTAQEPMTQDPMAQDPAAQQPTDIEAITVMAPRVTYQLTDEGDTRLPMRLKVAEKSASVEFGDLDLTRTADLYTLEERVAVAAAQVCEALAQEYPDGTPSTPVCTRRATEDAMARVQLTARQANR